MTDVKERQVAALGVWFHEITVVNVVCTKDFIQGVCFELDSVADVITVSFWKLA